MSASACERVRSNGKREIEKRRNTKQRTFVKCFNNKRDIERIVMGFINETNKQQNDDEMEVFFLV